MAPTEQKKCWAGDVLLESGNQTFPRALVLAVRNMLFLIVEIKSQAILSRRSSPLRGERLQWH